MKIKIILVLCLLLLPHGLWAEELPLATAELVSEQTTTPGQRKLAILPFRTTNDVYHFLEGDKSFVEVTQLFHHHSLTAMADTGRFDILAGDEVERILRAKNLELSSDLPLVAQMAMGEALGVDYLIVGTILEAREEQIPYVIHVSGERGQRYHGSFVVDYRVMVMATQEVKWSDSVIITRDDVTTPTFTTSGSDGGGLALFHTAANQMAHKVMADIYPLRLVGLQENGEVIVNQGGALVARGERFDLFIQGDVVFDPETGESLGAAELWTATIKINRVAEKVSYGTVIDGEVLDSHIGARCQFQHKKNPRRSKPGRISDVQPTIDGGVVLPFD